MKLNSSYRYCHKITKQATSNFYLNLRRFHHRIRPHISAVSAFFLSANEIARSKSLKTETKIKKLEGMKKTLASRRFNDHVLLWPAVFSTIDIYNIPVQYFSEFIDGKLREAEGSEVRTREELIHFCYLSAGTIGMIGAYVLGGTKPKALEATSKLGIAIRLTMMMRDIAIDRDLGRIYLSTVDLKYYSISKVDIDNGQVSNEFIDLMRDLKSQAMGYYHDARDGIKYLPKQYQRLVKIILRLNLNVLRQIEENDYNVYNKSARLSWLEKVIIILNTK